MAKEEFSFPTIKGEFSSTIDSPPLWPLPSASAASPVSSLEETSTEAHLRTFEGIHQTVGVHEVHCSPSYPIEFMQRRRFSSMAKGGKSEEDEEKMDELWENFNEELSKSRNLKLGFAFAKSADEMVKLGCVQVQPMKLPAINRNNNNNNNAVISTKREAVMVAFVKVLKKLFLIRSSRPKLKTRSW